MKIAVVIVFEDIRIGFLCEPDRVLPTLDRQNAAARKVMRRCKQRQSIALAIKANPSEEPDTIMICPIEQRIPLVRCK
ncbi:hypothetical protein [Paenibacillus cisolokensis]|uniref:hypothetical protein n=1 Tax=Paenibacillus cisolokensis TaxID=1658519 RepID=UPI001BCFE881|nr:hypothetical protein [Paenibacillus cisolokensis]